MGGALVGVYGMNEKSVTDRTRIPRAALSDFSEMKDATQGVAASGTSPSTPMVSQKLAPDQSKPIQDPRPTSGPREEEMDAGSTQETAESASIPSSPDTTVIFEKGGKLSAPVPKKEILSLADSHDFTTDDQSKKPASGGAKDHPVPK